MVQGIQPEVHLATRLLPDAERETVERAIVNYAAPKGFCDAIGSVIYRIWNAIKSIFGCSDWQLAQNALKKGLGDRVVSLIQVEHSTHRTSVNLQGCRVFAEQVINTLFETAPAFMEKYAPRGDVSAGAVEELSSQVQPLMTRAIEEAIEAFQQPVEDLVGAVMTELRVDFNPEQLREITDLLLDSPVSDFILDGMLIFQNAESRTEIEAQFEGLFDQYESAFKAWAGEGGSRIRIMLQNTAFGRKVMEKVGEMALHPHSEERSFQRRFEREIDALDQARTRFIEGQRVQFEAQAVVFRQMFGTQPQVAGERPASPRSDASDEFGSRHPGNLRWGLGQSSGSHDSVRSEGSSEEEEDVWPY